MLNLIGVGVAQLGISAGWWGMTAFGGMSTLGLGWSLGGMAQGLLGTELPPVTQGKLTDLGAGLAGYGMTVPRVHGRARVRGVPIWTSELIPTRHEEEVEGGKGMGGTSQEVESYTYSVHMAFVVNDAPSAAVPRIWGNGKLVRDTRASNPGFAGRQDNIRVYLGGADQVPDSLMVAIEGKAPAYRGRTLVVFEHFQLAEFNNSVPLLEFEVYEAGTSAPPAAHDLGNGATAAADPLTGNVWTVQNTGSGLRVQVWNAVSGALVRDFSFESSSGAPTIAYVPNTRTFWIGGAANGASGPPNDYQVTVVSADAFVPLTAFQVSGSVFWNGATVVFNPDMLAGPSVWCFNQNGVSGGGGRIRDALTYAETGTCNGTDWCFAALYCETPPPYDLPDWMAWKGDGYLRAFSNHIVTVGYGNWMDIWDSREAILLATVRNPAFGATETRHAISWDRDRRVVWWAAALTAGLWQVGVDDFTLTLVDATISPQHLLYADGELYIVHPGGVLKRHDPDTLAVLETIGTYDLTNNIGGDGIDFTDWGRVVFAAEAIGGVGRVLSIPAGQRDTFTPGTVGAAVAAISAEAGYAAGEYDVSQLTDTLDGFTRTQLASARSLLETLMAAYYFDAVVTADATHNYIKFVKRGGTVAAVIPAADLAAHTDDTLPARVRIVRTNDAPLPNEIALGYLDIETDYNKGVQYSRRLVTHSQQKGAKEISVGLTGAQAKRITEVWLYNAWAERSTLTFFTTRKYRQLEPTDLVQVVDDTAVYTLRITDSLENGPVVEWNGKLEDVSLYSGAGEAAAALPAGQSQVYLPTPAIAVFVDSTLLLDIDDDCGWYLTVYGALAADFRSCLLYRSADGGQTYTPLPGGVFAAAPAIGYATTALGDWAGGNTFDESNSVTVLLADAQRTLAPVSEQNVLNGGGAFLLKSGSGWELAQYKNRVLNADGSYTLSGLLRGRRGTEWAMAGHAAGDLFLLLGMDVIARIADSSALVGVARDYKPVSAGMTLSQTHAVQFTNTAAGKECYAPVAPGLGRDASGNLSVTWQRRTRIGGVWRNYVDASLGETTESYEVDILSGSGGSVVRTLAGLTSPSASYTAAQQTTDFGSLQTTIYVNIYQLSDVVGRGFPRSATLSIGADTTTKLLLHADGLSGANSFPDSSAYSRVVTPYGNVNTSVAQARFGATAGYFDGSGDGLSVPASADFAFGTGDFTIEFWAYIINGGHGSASALMMANNTWGIYDGWALVCQYDPARIKFVGSYNYTPAYLDTVSSVSNNTWHHIAVTRKDGVGRLFVDGVKMSEAAMTNNFTRTELGIGGKGQMNNDWFLGYLDEVRILKGVAAYTADFTPPALPFDLLAERSFAALDKEILADSPYTFYKLNEGSGTQAADSSGNALHATYVNTPSLNTWEDGYRMAKFNGTDEYVALPSGFADFTGGLTFEAVVRTIDNTPSYGRIFHVGSTGSNNDSVVLAQAPSGSELNAELWNGAASQGSFSTTGGTFAPTGIYHVALTMDASRNVNIFINGVSRGGGTWANLPSNIARSGYLGRAGVAGYYIDKSLARCAVYQSALSADRIAAHYAAFLSGV